MRPMILPLFLLAGAAGADDLSCLTDEFDSPASLGAWLRVHQTEGYSADQLASVDIATTQAGRLVMVPHTCTWYQDYRGPMLYKSVTGDFVATVMVRANGRQGAPRPRTQFSLAGIMARTPREITPETWEAGRENYVFLSLGWGSDAGTHQYEVKTTVDSQSTLILSPAPADEATLQIARIGPHIIMLRRDAGGAWVVHRRYRRDDFPQTLQVGPVTYTNWEKASVFSPRTHNRTVLTPPLPPGVVDPNPAVPFEPDLVGSYEYARYARPVVPPELIGADLSNAAAVTDGQLLAFLGAAGDVPAPPPIGDFNQDGGIDGADVEAFFLAWEAGEGSADVNADGGIDGGDVETFFVSWEAGGCG